MREHEFGGVWQKWTPTETEVPREPGLHATYQPVYPEGLVVTYPFGPGTERALAVKKVTVVPAVALTKEKPFGPGSERPLPSEPRGHVKVMERYPERAIATVTYTPRIEIKPKPTITQQFVGAVEWVLGGELEELAFKKTLELGGMPEEKWQEYWVRVGEPVTRTLSGEVAYRQTGILTGRKAIEEFAYVPVGAVSVAESFVGREPTLVSSSVAYVLSGGKKEVFGSELEKISEHPGLLFGEFVGEYLAGKAFWWVGGKAWSGLQRVTPSAIKEPISYSVKFGRVAKVYHGLRLWRIEHLPTWRGSAIDVYLAKHSGWYYTKTGGIAVGEVVIPPTPEVVSYAKLQALSGAYEMTVAPRTGGVWLGRYLVEPTKKKALPHLFVNISKGWIAGPSYLEETSFQRVHPETSLTPLVSQQQLTRMGVFPYVPKVVSTTGKKGISYVILGFSMGVTRAVTEMEKSVSTSFKIEKPKRKTRIFGYPLQKEPTWQPTLEFERIKYSPVDIFESKPEKREKPVLIPRIGEFQDVESALSTKTEQIAKTIETAMQTLVSTSRKAPSFEVPSPPLSKRGGGKGGSRFGQDLFGAWFKHKRHIKTPEQMIKTYMEMEMPKIKIRGK